MRTENQEATVTIHTKAVAESVPRILVDALHIYGEPDGTVIMVLLKTELTPFVKDHMVDLSQLDQAQIQAFIQGAFAMSPSSALQMAEQFEEFAGRLRQALPAFAEKI